MSDQAKGSVPWDQPGQDNQAATDSGSVNDGAETVGHDLIEVSCPKCGQALALGREYLGGHCLCSTCDGLMRVSSEEVPGEENRIVVQIVEKETGKKVGNTAPTYAPDRGGAVINKNTRPVKPWPKEFKGLASRRAAGNRPELKKEAASEDGGDPSSNLLQVPCPDCGQVLALGREILGSHCLCSVCEGLMLISLKNIDGEGMKVIAEKVDKVTGEKTTDAPSTSSPEKGGSAMEEDWENTRPVKMWAGSSGADQVNDSDDMGLTMPVPKMDTDDDDDMGLTMPVPKMDTDDDDMGLTMPVPKMDTDDDDMGLTVPVPKMDASESAQDDDWKAPAPSQSQAPTAAGTPQASPTPSEPQAPAGGGGQPWEEKNSTGRQGVKLAPPGSKTGPMSGKAPPPTSGAVPTMTTPPTKAPPPTTGSVPTLDPGQVAARSAASGDSAAWRPPGAEAVPSGKKTQPQAPQKKAGKPEEKKKDAPQKKKSSPFGNTPTAPATKKKAPKRRRGKSHKGLILTLLMIPLLLGALALFIVSPGIVPGGIEAREYIDGKIDEGVERLEELLAKRAMSTGSEPEASGKDGEADLGLAPGAEADPDPGEASSAPPAIPTYERDATLQKVLSQEGEQVIRRFYGASTVEEKLAFVVGRGEARSDMETYYAGEELLPTVREVMFRGGTRDMETGYYYGVFDVLERENDIPRRWCVVDAGTGLYQVDWILYRQIVASELGGFLSTPQEEGVTGNFTMLMKLEGRVDERESPWLEGAVRVQLQVPMISSNWYPVLMKKSLAESMEFNTKLANDHLTIGVVKIGWVKGDKDSSERQPAILGIERWGAWASQAF